MLRLTTNVTVSPASSARSSSAAWRIVLDRLRPRLGEQRRQLVLATAARPSRPFAIAPADEIGADRRGASRRPDPRRGMKLQYFVLIDVEHALRRPTPRRCTAGRRTAARSARRRPPPGVLRTWCGDGNGCSGEMWSPFALSPPRSVAPAATSSRPPVGEVRRDLDRRRRACSRARLGDEPLHVLDRHRRSPTSGSGSSGWCADPGPPVLLARPRSAISAGSSP